MRILLVEPYDTGSHAAWVAGYRSSSGHEVDVLRLSGANWKWRMHGGAVTLARQFCASELAPDLVLSSDMLDVCTFQALTRQRTSGVPYAVYFHENQLSYPWPPDDPDPASGRDLHYAFVNYTTALASDAVFFNSRYHRETFLDALDGLLGAFPDRKGAGNVEAIRARSAVLPLGVDLRRFDAVAPKHRPDPRVPLVVWNHRWEYDKNPEEFFDALCHLAERGVPFEVAVLGQSFRRIPGVFDAARRRLGARIVHFGFAERFEEYAGWLRAAYVIPVTSHQDFFGASVVEAIYCGAHPLLPRRLAYPELIPEEWHGEVFYDGRDELLRRLESILAAPPRNTEALRVHVARFDWTTQAGAYDDTLGRVVNQWNSQGGIE